MNLLKKSALGLAVASTAALTAVPAQAQYYNDYRHRNNNAAPAIIAGVLGIAAIAAIASSNNNDRYRDRYYYRDGRRYDRRYDRRYQQRRGYYGQQHGYNGYNSYDGYYGQRYGY